MLIWERAEHQHTLIAAMQNSSAVFQMCAPVKGAIPSESKHKTGEAQRHTSVFSNVCHPTRGASLNEMPSCTHMTNMRFGESSGESVPIPRARNVRTTRTYRCLSVAIILYLAETETSQGNRTRGWVHHSLRSLQKKFQARMCVWFSHLSSSAPALRLR